MGLNKFPVNNELEFNKFLVREYLRLGSVDEVLRIHRFNIPISYSQYHRILDKWGIVKAAGPNSKLSEVINFLARMVEESVPLEKLYRKMPNSFMTSAVTLYRILTYIKEGITRRIGTGLIISPFGQQSKILVGRDVSTPRQEFGKSYGCFSLPMGFSKISDSRENAIMRILQQEVFADLAVERKIPASIIPVRPKPFLFLDIADVRVEVFNISLPRNLSKIESFSSYKLTDFKFIDIGEFDELEPKVSFRSGVAEAIQSYKKYLELRRKGIVFNPLQVRSKINYHFSRFVHP